MCIRDSLSYDVQKFQDGNPTYWFESWYENWSMPKEATYGAVSYTHLRAHETVLDLVCRLLLDKKK